MLLRLRSIPDISESAVQISVKVQRPGRAYWDRYMSSKKCEQVRKTNEIQGRSHFRAKSAASDGGYFIAFPGFSLSLEVEQGTRGGCVGGGGSEGSRPGEGDQQLTLRISPPDHHRVCCINPPVASAPGTGGYV